MAISTSTLKNIMESSCDHESLMQRCLRGRDTCKLLNHSVLKSSDGVIMLAWEIKISTQLPNTRDSIVFQWVLDPTH
jgi:hypothetical protein